jgi:acetyltransferase-like isoleucine patch superfamily enzyme
MGMGIMGTVMGRHSYGKIENIGHGEIQVGNFCSIAGDVTGITWGHNSRWVTTFPFSDGKFSQFYPESEKIEGHPVRDKIVIGHDVWIGQGVKIIAPSYISHGAVLGAGSVVRGFVEPYVIVYGNPIMTYGKRFKDEQIEALLNICWWLWDDEKINDNIHLLCSDRIEEFIDAHSKVSQKRVCTTDDRIGEALPPEDLR